MKYAAIIVLYNPNKQVVNNIKTYINKIEKVYVIDNSINNNKDLFVGFKNIEYIPNFDNFGVAKALNIGAQKAIKDKFNWLLTMDQDSFFYLNSFDNLIKYIEEAKKSKKTSDELKIDFNKIGIVSPRHITLKNKKEKKLGTENVLMIMTSGNLINLDAYKKCGGFKDWLFIDCVDFDYCLNLRNHGYEILQLNEVELKHNLGNLKSYRFFNKLVFSSNHDAIRRYYIVRNRYYLNEIYKNKYPYWCELELKQTKKEIIKILLFENDKINKLRLMLKGYIHYKKGIKGKLNEK